MEPFEDEDFLGTKYNRRIECSGCTVVDRFFDRHPAFKEKEVVFELINPVYVWIKWCQSLFSSVFPVETMIVIKRNSGHQILAEDASYSFSKSGLSRPTVPATPRVKI
jgi:hypothetical protein